MDITFRLKFVAKHSNLEALSILYSSRGQVIDTRCSFCQE